MTEKEVANVFAKLADDGLLSPEEPPQESSQVAASDSNHELPAAECSDDCVEINISQESNSASVESVHVSACDKDSQDQKNGSEDDVRNVALPNVQISDQNSDDKGSGKQLAAVSVKDSRERVLESSKARGLEHKTSGSQPTTDETELNVSGATADEKNCSKSGVSSKTATQKTGGNMSGTEDISVKAASANEENPSVHSQDSSVPDLLMECEVEEEPEEGDMDEDESPKDHASEQVMFF